MQRIPPAFAAATPAGCFLDDHAGRRLHAERLRRPPGRSPASGLPCANRRAGEVGVEQVGH